MILRKTISLSLLGLVLAVGGCEVGSSDPFDPTDPVDPVDPVDPDPTAFQLAGDITESATIGGTIQLLEDATIKPGVVITIEAGSVFQAQATKSLRVEGTLVVDGTAERTVSMNPVGGAAWNGVIVETGGAATLAYAVGRDVGTLMYCHAGALTCALDGVDFQSIGQAMIADGTATITASRLVDMANGGITLRATGELTIIDSYILTSDHDLIITSGGRLTVDYSELGGAQGSYEHCNFHIGSAASVSITNTNIISSVYGIMIGSTQNAVITGNNFMENDANNDILILGGAPTGNMSGNYWDQGAPTVPGFNTGNPAPAPLAAGPRI